MKNEVSPCLVGRVKSTAIQSQISKMSALSEFVVDVRRPNEGVWTAKVNAKSFEARSECELRSQVRTYLLQEVAVQKSRSLESLKATLRRTWRVRIFEDDNDSDSAYGFALFD